MSRSTNFEKNRMDMAFILVGSIILFGVHTFARPSNRTTPDNSAKKIIWGKWIDLDSTKVINEFKARHLINELRTEEPRGNEFSGRSCTLQIRSATKSYVKRVNPWTIDDSEFEVGRIVIDSIGERKGTADVLLFGVKDGLTGKPIDRGDLPLEISSELFYNERTEAEKNFIVDASLEGWFPSQVESLKYNREVTDQAGRILPLNTLVSDESQNGKEALDNIADSVTQSNSLRPIINIRPLSKEELASGEIEESLKRAYQSAHRRALARHTRNYNEPENRRLRFRFRESDSPVKKYQGRPFRVVQVEQERFAYSRDLRYPQESESGENIDWRPYDPYDLSRKISIVTTQITLIYTMNIQSNPDKLKYLNITKSSDYGSGTLVDCGVLPTPL